MAEIEKFMNIAIGDIEKIMNIAKGDIEKVMGVEIPAPTTSYQGGRGISMGGIVSNTGVQLADIEYKAMSSDGDTLDFGDILEGSTRAWVAMAGNDSRAVGMTGRAGGSAVNHIEYSTISNLGNATEFGDSTEAREDSTGTGNGTRGVCAGGYGTGNVTTIDYITVASANDAADYNDMTRASSTMNSGNAHSTRGIWWMGWDGDYDNLDANYITIATTNVAADFGDWSAAISAPAAIGLIESKNVWGGGYTSGASSHWATMEYRNPTSLGNTASQGDLGSATARAAGKFTNGVRGEIWGGAPANDNVQKFTIASDGDASHAGEIRNGSRVYWDGWSGD